MSNLGEMIVGGMLVGASAVTGGASAGAGETVSTGDSSARVEVTNVINANNDGGTSHTIVEKTVNGVREVTEEIKKFAPGEPVEVEVNVEARAEGSNTPEAVVTTELSTEFTAEAGASTTEAEAQEARWNFGSYVRDRISNIASFFASVWSWWSS